MDAHGEINFKAEQIRQMPTERLTTKVRRLKVHGGINHKGKGLGMVISRE